MTHEPQNTPATSGRQGTLKQRNCMSTKLASAIMAGVISVARRHTRACATFQGHHLNRAFSLEPPGSLVSSSSRFSSASVSWRVAYNEWFCMRSAFNDATIDVKSSVL